MHAGGLEPGPWLVGPVYEPPGAWMTTATRRKDGTEPDTKKPRRSARSDGADQLEFQAGSSASMR